MDKRIQELEDRVRELEKVLGGFQDALRFCRDEGTGYEGTPGKVLADMNSALTFYNPPHR